MANTVQESIDKIRESFRTIKTTAEKANVKFKEEGKPFVEARNKLSPSSELGKSIDSACNFFSDVAKKYSDESVIDNIITDPKTEQDRALRDYRIYQLAPYTKLDNRALDVLENKPQSFSNVSDNPDESAIVTVNDYVRLITSEPYKAYKKDQNSHSSTMLTPPKKPEDYSLTREQKKKKIIDTLSNNSYAKDLKKLEEYRVHGHRKAKPISFISPFDGFALGLRVGGIIGIIFTVLAAIAIVVSVIIGRIPFSGIADEAPMALNIILTILAFGISLCIYGAICYYAGMVLIGILLFIGCIVIDLFIALIWPVSAMVVATINSKREKSHLSFYNHEKAELKKEFDKKLAVELEKELAVWEKKVESYRIAYKNYSEQSISYEKTKEDIVNNYYREIARIAATSKPIVMSTSNDLTLIKKHVEIIQKERTNLYIKLNVKFDYDEALICYKMLAAGEVDTYEQAIAMMKNLKAGERLREERRMAQERKEAEERSRALAAERAALERKRQRELQYKEEQRIKEEKKEQERKAEERIRRLENAIRNAEAAQREQTNALLRAAIANIKTMNEQNDLIEENNKLLDEIKKEY